ncbi:MAG TPA: hypothetical protein VLZ83_11210 [Edaphocola sp.]|nr:hypothetical protein [Edaphocola sp.]
MKTIFLILATIFISNLTFGQTEFCKDFKTGVFQFLGYNGGVYTIIRTDTNQFERNSKQAKHSYMKIKWLNDCQYVLYDRTEYKWGKQPEKDTTIKEIYNTIYKFEKPDKYFVKSYFSGFADTIETVFKKLDTSKCYNNLFQLSEFSEYKNSKSYGQTMLGEIHSIDFYESNKNKNKYLITFETTYEAEKLNWTRLLDSTTIYLKDGQQITNSNCRFKGEYEDEILAVYSSSDQNKEAKIIMAFRCNRQTEKIEPVDIKLVQYKEIDRQRIKW